MTFLVTVQKTLTSFVFVHTCITQFPLYLIQAFLHLNLRVLHRDYCEMNFNVSVLKRYWGILFLTKKVLQPSEQINQKSKSTHNTGVDPEKVATIKL